MQKNYTAVPTWTLLVAFLAIYFVWGSTYLAIRFALESMPPFIMIGTRYAVAGLVMYGWLSMRGQKQPHVKCGAMQRSLDRSRLAWEQEWSRGQSNGYHLE